MLVLHDMLDIAPAARRRFVKNFMTGQASVAAAIMRLRGSGEGRQLPAPEHCY